MTRNHYFGLGLLLLLILSLMGCNNSADKPLVKINLAPESALPDFVRERPEAVQEAYRFAIANPEILEIYPCYCGCNALGHKNNLQCYIKEIHSDGTIEFETHAFG